MLQKIRDNTQGLLAKLFIGFIIAVFALFGVDTLVGTFLNTVPGLQVNDVEISSVEIETLAQRKAQEFITELGEDADFSGFDETLFRSDAVNELIQRELMNQSAANSGMVISPASIDRRILQTEDFRIDGVYNDQRATLLLQSMGFTPSSYKAALARDTLLNQLLTAYTSSGFVTPGEIARLAALMHQKRDFRFVGLALDTAGTDIEISEEEISAYYAENEQLFLQEEQVRIAWLELDRENMLDEISVTEEQIRARYDEEVAAFLAETERRAAHILLEATDDAAVEAALVEAAAIKSRIDNGEDFAALAAEFSDDSGSAQDGGDVGYTTGDNFDPAFETALQSLEVGQVSDPVRTEFGVHLIKLLEVNATESEPYEARRAVLERDLKSSEVETLFIARSEELGNLAFESVDLAEPAAALGLQIQESDWFGRSGGTGITAMRAVIDASFSADVLEERLNSDLVEVDSNRSVVIHVLDHKLSEIRPLETVKEEISQTLRFERMREQARMLGETIVSSLQSGQNIDSLLEAQGLTWNQFTEVKRDDTRINPAITEQVFSMLRPAADTGSVKGFALPGGEYVVVELQSVTDGKLEDLDAAEAEGMKNYISQQTAALDVAGLISSLENRADVTGKDLVVPDELVEEF